MGLKVLHRVTSPKVAHYHENELNSKVDFTMDLDINFQKQLIFQKHWLFIGLFFMLLVVLIILAMPKTQATTTVNFSDPSNAWINDTSGPRVMLGLEIHNNSQGMSRVNWINVTFYDVSGFDPTVNLSSLTDSATSGVIIYNESKGTAGFQAGEDFEANAGSPVWGNNLTHYWVNITLDSTYNGMPSAPPGAPNFYVVIQTGVNVNSNTKFTVNITVDGIAGTWGNNTNTGNTKVITIDADDPTISNPTVNDGGSYFIYYNSTSTTVWYGNKMSGNHGFNVTGSAGDVGGSGLSHATFSSNILGSPSDDLSPNNWLGFYNTVNSGSTPAPSTITVRVYDNANNYDTLILNVGRDITAPSITDGYWTDISSSPYLWVDSGNDDDDIYYGDDMGATEVIGRITINPSDSSESEIQLVNFSTEVGSSPPDVTAPPYTGNYKFNISDTSNGQLTILVIDNVGNSFSDSSTWSYFRDTINPVINSGTWSDIFSSNYLWVDVSSGNDHIYYGDGMSSGQTGRLTIGATDSGSGVGRVRFSTAVGTSPPDDTSSPFRADYLFDSSDTSNGTLNVTVYDRVGNSVWDNSTWKYFRDIIHPQITDGDWSESSPYLFINLTNDITNNIIFYSHGMGASQVNGQLNFMVSDDVQLSLISYSTGVGRDSGSDSLSGTTDNPDVIYYFENSDTFSNYLLITLYDACGNSASYPSVWRIIMDTTTPTITYNYPNAAGKNTSWHITDPGKIIDIDFIWGGLGNAPLDYASYQIGSSGWVDLFAVNRSTDYAVLWEIPWATLNIGLNQISLRVIDCVGNSLVHSYIFDVSGFGFLKELSAPTIQYNTPTGGATLNWYSSDPGSIINIDFQWTGGAPLVNATYRIGTGSWVYIFNYELHGDYDIDWSLDWASLNDGVNDISVRVYNKAGFFTLHSYAASTGFRFRKDITPPRIVYNNPGAGGNTSWYASDPGEIIDIDFQWLDGAPLDYAEYKIGDGTWFTIFDIDQSFDYTDDWTIWFESLVEGENQIHIRVADMSGNQVTHSFLIGFNGFIFKKDSEAPNADSISIDAGVQYTDSVSVTLTISASDSTSGIYQMIISNDGTFDTEQWETYSTTKLWTLSVGDGSKIVYIKFRDYALSESSIINDLILLDTTAPHVTSWALVPGNVTEDTIGPVNITVALNDNTIGSGVASVGLKFSINGISNDQFSAMKYGGNGIWYFEIDIEQLGYTWDELQTNNINYTIRATDYAGNIYTSQPRFEYIDPINDLPKVTGAPLSIILVIGDDYEIDFSAYLTDEDDNLSSLILSTDSNYASVSGLVVTFNYPSTMTAGQVQITISDGTDSTNWPIQITVLPKVITITKDHVTAKIYLTTIGQGIINTSVQSPGGAPENRLQVGSPFSISVPGGVWTWVYIEVDYSTLDTSTITESSQLLYYWDSSSSSWKVCEITSPDTTKRIVDANVTNLGTFTIFGVPKPDIPDNDGDLIPDSVDPDDDNDGMLDTFEDLYPELDPFTNDSAGDIDNDGLTNYEEFLINTNPTDEDTDGDGMPDKWEIDFGLDPLNNTGVNGADGDPDGDGYSNLEEYKYKTWPKDETSKPKLAEDGDNWVFIIIGIIIVVIIIILLSYMMLRSRAGAGPGAGPGRRPGELEEAEEGFEGPSDEEIGPDLAEDYELATEVEPEEVEVIKAPTPAVEFEGEQEVFELGMAEPCGVCQGVIAAGNSAFSCPCGLISHVNCMGTHNCLQCGRPLDFEALGIPEPGMEMEVPPELEVEKPVKPMITREIKREIKESVPPESAYFVFIPEYTSEKKITKYLNDYFKSRKTGTSTPTSELKDVNIFIGLNAAKKMLDHCYTQGKVKEVMGLILGETYHYNGKTFSVARDVATSELDATEVDVRFDSFDKLFEQLEVLRYDYQILGWYHSHPDYSSFMSPTDLQTQRRMFKLPYQYAVVIDPIRFDMKAFTYDKLRKKKGKELPFAIFNLDEYQRKISVPESEVGKGKITSKPTIRSETKQKIEDINKPPDKAYLTNILGVTKDAEIGEFLKEYFNKRRTGRAVKNDDLVANVSLFLQVNASKKMLDHCFEFRNVKEVMGLLIGKTYRYKDKVISIVKDVVTSELEASEVNVRFNSFDELFDQLDNLKYDYQIVGWYHSHPGHTCFMSPTDVDTQKRMFKHDHQYALVIDPINFDMKGFALDLESKNQFKERGYAIVDFKD